MLLSLFPSLPTIAHRLNHPTRVQVPEDAPFLVVKTAQFVAARLREEHGESWLRWEQFSSALGCESPASQDKV
jgi:hypothetical protein